MPEAPFASRYGFLLPFFPPSIAGAEEYFLSVGRRNADGQRTYPDSWRDDKNRAGILGRIPVVRARYVNPNRNTSCRDTWDSFRIRVKRSVEN